MTTTAGAGGRGANSAMSIVGDESKARNLIIQQQHDELGKKGTTSRIV